jgi:hypothetical protein
MPAMGPTGYQWNLIAGKRSPHRAAITECTKSSHQIASPNWVIRPERGSIQKFSERLVYDSTTVGFANMKNTTINVAIDTH